MSSPEPRTEPGHVVVVGGSVGGVRTVQALRRAGYAGRLTLVSQEPHLPYDRPPLSKELLGADHSGDPHPLLSEAELVALDVDLRLRTRAVGLDPPAHRLRVVHSEVDSEGETELDYDRLVIATGAAARRLGGGERLAGVHVIRDLDDVAALRAELRPDARAVVVGAGFIGAEFAAAALARGLAVTLVEAGPAPLAHVLGPEIGAEVGSVHAAHGARLVVGAVVAELRGEAAAVTAVVLDDGTELPADLVVVGIGAVPATDWLDGSGVPVGNGIDCGPDLEVLGVPDVYAVGDVARWPHPAYDEPIRVEHWTNAGDQAQVVAAHLTGAPRPRVPVPYVWSDQYGHRIQIVGRPAAGTLAATSGSMAGSDLVALYAGPDGALVGALVVDDPRRFTKLRKAVTAGTAAAEVEATLLAPA